MQAYDGRELGHLVRSQRIRRGLTQLQLAGLSTVGVRTIRDLEAGRTGRPHPITAQLLASALGMSGSDQSGYAVTAHASPAADEAEPVTDVPDRFPVPVPAGAAVGRDRDVEALCALVVAKLRLITVTGLPGTGKTRLAIEVARTLDELGGMHVLWISEEASGTPSERYGTDDGRRRAAPGIRRAISRLLADGAPAVVVIDSADAAHWPDGVPRPPHPGLQVITTARRPLSMPGEHVYPISPLPADADAADSPALCLFNDYVSWFRPSAGIDARSPVAAELCRKLDGNPRLLAAAAEALSVLDLESMLHHVSADVSAAVHEFAPHVYDGTAELIESLAAGDRTLLTLVSTLAADWSVRDLARQLNQPPLRLSLRIRDLLEKGLIRPASSDGAPRFRVLELVRSIMSDAARASVDAPAGKAAALTADPPLGSPPLA